MSDISKSVLKGLISSVVVIFLISTVIGFAELFFDISDELLDLVSVAILGIAAFSSGYISTQLRRSNGMLQGILCGAGLFLLTLLLSILFSEIELRDIAAVKAIICLTSGIVGGVIGVNTKKTKERH